MKIYSIEGWPSTKEELKGPLKPYWAHRGDFAIERNVLMMGSRIVNPSPMRMEVLDNIHEGHQGITKCRARAKGAVWWPGISREIQDLVENCRICAAQRESKTEPLIPTPFPERPWQIIGTDLFEQKGQNFLLVIDYYSRYVEVARLGKSKASKDIIVILKDMFARHGIPEQVRSDNGPQYASAEFAQFSRDWCFKHTTSSPTFAQSNGEVERGVRTVKNIFNKEKDPSRAMLAYRSTPLANGHSPAELLMGSKLRGTVPIIHTELKPKLPKEDELREKEERSREKQKSNYDLRHNAKPQVPLLPDMEVHVKDMNTPGFVVSKAQSPRSYFVETPSNIIRRNRSQLLPMPAEVEDTVPPPVVEADQAKNKVRTPAKPPPSPCLSTRRRRTNKPSLKVRENLGLT